MNCSHLSLFVCAALAAMLVGCGSSEDGAGSSSAPQTEADPAETVRAVFDAVIAGDHDAYVAHSTEGFVEDGPLQKEFERFAAQLRSRRVSLTVDRVREEGDAAIVNLTCRWNEESSMEFKATVRKVRGVWKVDGFRPSTAPSARLRVAENGKRIVGAIIAANIDLESNMRGPVWPEKGSWEDSNAYFARLMGNGGGAGLDGLSFDVFAGCGILPADDAAGLAEGGNVWTMAAGIGDSPDSRTPFLWTRNLRLTQEDLDAYVRDPNTDRSLAHRLDASMLPFGDEAVVMITKGGAMYPLKASQLTTKWFFGCVSPENVNGLEIVEAR